LRYYRTENKQTLENTEWSNKYCVGFFFGFVCLRLLYPCVASFSGLSICDCPFGSNVYWMDKMRLWNNLH